MKTYRSAFWIALAGNLALAGILAGWWWRSHPPQSAASIASNTQAEEAAAVAESPAMAAMPSEPALAPVPLASPRMRGLPMSFGTVTRKAVRDRIRTTGNVMVNESRLSYVQMRFSGYIRKVFVAATYERVEEGQPLFTIFSPDVVATEREYVLALQNQQRLLESTVPGVTAGALALPAAALERLRQWGVPEAEIARLEAAAAVREEIEIGSPVTGYVVERQALPNKFVEPNTQLYTVANLTDVWVIAQVLQSDAGRIRQGQAATIDVDAYAGQSFAGRVDFIYPDVDIATRTTRVRIVLPNPNLRLKPGMFANVTFQIPMGEQLTIPFSGLLQTGTRSIVFVDDGSGYLQPREIELGPAVGEDIVVTKGLRDGERIVTSANFLIDSESQLQAALRRFAAPAGASGDSTGAMPAAPSSQAKVDFQTEPNPPRRGTNTFRVRLTDASGAPISGAEVSVVFFMPSMPAMGMAEMRLESRLSEGGAGNYQATGSLESGGTWQVTITARRNGQAIASRQMNVLATGGM